MAQSVAPTLSLCLSAICTDIPNLLAIKDFCQQHPDIQLDISTEHLHGVQKQLEQEKAELAIGPRYGLDDRHEFVELNRIDTITVAAPSLSEQLQPMPVKHNSLRQCPHILINKTGGSTFEHINVLPYGSR